MESKSNLSRSRIAAFVAHGRRISSYLDQEKIDLPHLYTEALKVDMILLSNKNPLSSISTQ
jgi:hypothetical protein